MLAELAAQLDTERRKLIVERDQIFDRIIKEVTTEHMIDMRLPMRMHRIAAIEVAMAHLQFLLEEDD